MSTSHDQRRRLEFEPNQQGRQDQNDTSRGNYYEQHHAVHTPAQHDNDQQGSLKSWIARGNNRSWVGAGLAVVAAGAFVGLTRNKWSSWGNSLSELADKSGLTGNWASAGQKSGSQASGSTSQSASGSAQKSSSQKSASSPKASSQKGSSQADASLNRDVASSGIKSSPSSSKGFTDEGATGNND